MGLHHTVSGHSLRPAVLFARSHAEASLALPSATMSGTGRCGGKNSESGRPGGTTREIGTRQRSGLTRHSTSKVKTGFNLKAVTAQYRLLSDEPHRDTPPPRPPPHPRTLPLDELAQRRMWPFFHSGFQRCQQASL